MTKRPIGISILSVLGIIGGIALLIMQLFMTRFYTDSSEYTGVSATSMLANLIALGVWALLYGTGMWTGKKWGWWLGATYISYSVLRNANALLLISDIASQYPDEEINVSKYYLKHTLRVIVHSLIACYFFKANVLEYFGFSDGKKWKRIFIYIGVTVLIFIVFATVTHVL